MKRDIQPTVNECPVHCACGTTFTTLSVQKEIRVSLCSQCHPFFTGATKYVDTAGRIEKFNKKYNKAQ